MLAPVFFIDPDEVNHEIVTLSEDESHHALKVMRLKTGALIILIDGQGNGYRSEIIKAGRKIVEVNILDTIRNFGEPEIKLTLAAGLSTNYKFDTVVEKGTELGVSRFVPLMTEKSKIKLDDPKRLKSKQTRYQKVARSALKQCRRSYIPEICKPVSFSDYLKEIDSDSLNLIFHPGKTSTSIDKLTVDDSIRRVNLIVGPESGFSDDEIALAQSKNIQSVTLGNRILRTETAGFVVCALIMNRLGQLS